MDRVFLDANVLFSAAYREDSGLRKLWTLHGATLLTSDYAFEEALRNLDEAAQRRRLQELGAALERVGLTEPTPSVQEIGLPENDAPILEAAIAAKASHLLTGDRKAFGPHFGKRLVGVLVLKPADYLNRGAR